MKKTFAFLLPLIFFISCSNFELQMGTISVKSSDTYTIELEETKAPIGSYVRIKAIPAPGYYIESVNDSSGGIKYTTPFEDNIYYIIVTDKQVNLSCYTAKLPTYSINSPTAIYSYNSNLVFDKTSTYAGDTVTVQVVPDEYYYVDESSVKIKTTSDGISNVDFSFEPPCTYSFIMPAHDVYVYSEAKLGINIVFEKESYLLEDTIQCNFETRFTDKNLDIYVSKNFETSEYILAEENLTTSKSFLLDKNLLSYGKNKLVICPINTTKEELDQQIIYSTTLQIDLPDIPEGWTTTGFEKINPTDFTFNNIKDNRCIDIKYYFESDKSNIINASFYYSSKEVSFSDLTSKVENDKLVLWVEDVDLKVISPKITLDLSEQN